MLRREKRADRKAELFGDLIAMMEQRQKRAYDGTLVKPKATGAGQSVHGAAAWTESSPEPSTTFALNGDGNAPDDWCSTTGGDAHLLKAPFALRRARAAKAALNSAHAHHELCSADVLQATEATGTSDGAAEA